MFRGLWVKRNPAPGGHLFILSVPYPGGMLHSYIPIRSPSSSHCIVLNGFFPCIALWHSIHRNIRLSQLYAIISSWILSGVNGILWCTIHLCLVPSRFINLLWQRSHIQLWGCIGFCALPPAGTFIKLFGKILCHGYPSIYPRRVFFSWPLVHFSQAPH